MRKKQKRKKLSACNAAKSDKRGKSKQTKTKRQQCSMRTKHGNKAQRIHITKRIKITKSKEGNANYRAQLLALL